MKDYAKGLQFTFALLVSVALGIFIGYLIDQRFDTTPLFVIVFPLLSTAGSFMRFIKMMKEHE